MEIVSLIVGIVDKYAVEPAIRQVGYLTHCKSKLEKLQTQVNELSAAREGLALEVVRAEEKGEKIRTDVQNWLKDADVITEKANELRKPDTQAKMSCLRGVCPNPVLRYKLGRRSTKLKQAVVELYAKKDFAIISDNVRPQDVSVVSDKHYEPFDSRTLTVKKIMDELRIPNTDLILVYGIGGVGKTTLVEEVLRQAVKEKLFADAVMVTSVQNPDLEGIQKEIAIKLGMEVKESETMSVRAPRLCDRVKDKKVLVILDNILESIDLQSVGLPCLPNCRILLTSRTRKLLSSEKRSQKDFPLQVLNEEDAWRLFETKAGDVVKNPDIRTVATDVAKKCRGWPLLVVTVASSLRNRRNLPPWSDALRYLEVFDNEDSAEQEAYPALEWSYSQLDDRRLKPLFLICGILVHLGGSYTSLTSLLKYTFGLGLFKKNIDSVEHAQNALHSWIEELKDSCLLLNSEDNTSIRMHDLLRDVAISIASKDQHALLRAKGDDLKEWPNNDFLENCTMIALSCKNIPRLPEVLKCQQLELFHLEGKGLEIPGNFFEEMKELKVMDLTKARISSLPPSLHLLQNLRTLCLDRCALGDVALVGQLSQLEILSFVDSELIELPEEIGKLTRLRLLDLSGCSQLKVISPNVISRLTSLEDLRMKNSFNRWVPKGVSGERSNSSLSELKDLPHLAALSIHVPDAGSIPTDLFTDKLKRYQILIGTSSWEWNGVDETLNTLKLKLPTGCELDRGLEMLLKRSCEDLYLDGWGGADNVVHHSGSEDFQQLKHLHVENNAQFTHIITEEVVLPNLTSLEVHHCNLLTFVLSSSMARNLAQLQKLEIIGCESMEEIVSTKEYGEEKTDVMFCKLQHLKLGDLPKLSRFCLASWNVQFPYLESLEIRNCEKLKGFVFDPKPETEEVYFLFDDKVVLPNLTSLEVHRCNLLTFVLSSSMARNLAQLQKLEIARCESMEEIISTKEYGEEKTDVMFCKLQHLELGYLPELSRFCSASCNVQFPSLEGLEIRNCEKLKGFVFDPKPETEELGYLPELSSFCSISTEELGYLPELSRFCSASCNVRFPSMESLEIWTEEVYFLFDDKVVLPNLTSLEVHRCNFLTFVLSSSMARNLVQLQKLEITRCESMEEIVSTKENGEEKTDVMFCKLQHLKLEDLPKLSRFCSASCNVQFPSLESLKLFECGELKGFVFDPKPETEEVYFLFDDKVGLPKLEKLSIRELSISTTVWHNKLDPGSFYKLRDVDVHRCGRLISIITPSIAGRLNALRSLWISGCDRLEVVFEIKETPDTSTTQLKMSGCENLDSVLIYECEKLKYIFPCSVARGLQQLRHLRVASCKGMEEIVSKEEGLEMMPKFVFPKATNIEFINLDQLKSFYPGIHASEWPLLERVEVRECGKLDILVSKISSFQKHELDGLDTPIKHSLFLIDKDVSFPNLEKMALDRDMETWCGPSTSQLFRKLKSLTFEGGQKVSLYLDASFPHISVLRLHGMQKLMYLRNENFPGAGPVFPNLEVLRVERCSALKDIGSSAIPFNNLTTLEVYGCHSLKYLATYTIAKTLKRLREMVVGDCKTITEIGATTSDGDDAGNDGEISFCQLQSLELFELPSLQDFFSGNCIVKFPSLKTVNIYECPKLKINSSEWKSSPQLQGVQLTENRPRFCMFRWSS